MEDILTVETLAAVAVILGAIFGGWSLTLRKGDVEVEVDADMDDGDGMSVEVRNGGRFLLTWKRGRIHTSDMAEISAKISELRDADQPYEYFMDGKQIWPRQGE